MGRLFTTLGILMILAGVAGIVVTTLSPSSFNLQSLTESLASSPTAADLCNPGETLREETGASEYTPGQGYGRNVQYFCEDSEGNSRNVTGRFVTGLLGQVPDFIAGLGMQCLWSGLIGIGVMFAVIGAIISRISGGRRPYSTAEVYINGQSINAVQSHTVSRSAPAARGTLADKLQQLENARNAGLITSDEYDRLSQKALDEMQ